MKRYLFLGAGALLAASPAFAQSHQYHVYDCVGPEEVTDKVCPDYASDEIVTIGQIIGQTYQIETTSPASILTETDIDNRNQAYLSDLLRSQPGVSVNRSGPGGALTQIRLRGTEASHVLVLVDGIEVANPTAGEFDLSGIRAADIIRIEVLRGEQSALYGSDAIGGVVNIITRAGSTQKYWQASLEAGSFDTLDGQFNGAVHLGNATLTLGVGGSSTEGYDISGLSGEKDGSQSRAVNVGLNNLRLAGVTLSAKYGNSHLDTEFDEDLFFSGRLDDTDSNTLVDTQSARIDASFQLGSIENLITLSGHDIETDSRASFPSTSKGTRRKANWAAKAEISEGHSLTVLAETEKETYEITPSFAFSPARPKNTNTAIAGDYRGDFNGLNITASARQDFNDRFDDALTWKLGGTYALESFGGRLRANLGTGVKNPSLIELFGFYPESSFVGNPDLRPEESFGYGIGYTQKLLGDDLSVSIDFFKSELTDEIFTDFSSFPFLARNRGTDSEREGVELSADWDVADTLSVYGSATFLDTTENGVEELRRPDFAASLTATWQPIDKLNLTGSVDHTGSQMDTDFSTFAAVELDAFTLVGLNAAYDISDEVTLTLRGENLLDENYQEVVGYASQDRGIYGGLLVRFD